MVAVVAWGLPRSSKLALVLGALPPMALFVIEQRAVTGAFFTSSQAAYYALADGPPGCFRYGFGAGIGCLHEHGEYVAAVLPSGFTWKAVAMTTLRRLHLHFMDVANADPLMLLVALSPVVALSPSEARRLDWRAHGGSPRGRRRRPHRARVCPLLLRRELPGGGARFFADVIPLEHVMIATAAAFLVSPNRAPRSGPRIDLPRFAPIILATALAGFGLRTASDHVALREREGGRPFFEPDLLTEAGVHRGLLFAGTDHAFNLAFDPAARDATKALVVARSYGDDRDRLVWESQGRPAAYRYVFSGASAQLPELIAWEPPAVTRNHRYEAEAEWPPLEQAGGYLEPVFATGTCASGQRLLAIHPVGGVPFRGAISVPVPSAGKFLVRLLVAPPPRRPRSVRAPRRTLAGAPSSDSTPLPRNLEVLYLARKAREFSSGARLEVVAEGPGDLWMTPSS